MTKEQFKAAWDYVQSILDIDGDVVMLIFTSAVVWKLLHGGLNPSDAVAYTSAVGCFAYSNKGKLL